MDDFGLLVGRHFTTLPTLSDKNLSELQLDSKGRLILAGRFLAGTDSYGSGDSGLGILAVRNDADAVLTGVADGEYSPLQVDENGRLKVVADIEVANGHEKLEDAAHSSGDVGSYVLAVRSSARPTSANTDLDGDYASFFVNDNGELYIHDTDALAKLTEIDSVLDTIKTDTGNIDVSLNNIEADVDSLTHTEDAAHSSGDAGVMPLAVRADADGSLVDADGDYSPLQTDANGKLKTASELEPFGNEEYNATDNLVAGGDGLIASIGTTFVDVATIAVAAGEILHIYGWQWDCDKNAVGRIVTDDTVDTIVYKVNMNSSSMPGRDEHFSESGRIEIAGASNLSVKLQVRKRQGAADANASGSIHARKL